MSGRVTMICSKMLWPPKRAATREFWSDHQAVTRRSRYARSSVAITRIRRFRVLRIVRLTVKLRGRTEAPDGAEGAEFLSARGAKPQAHHGPLRRLLDATLIRWNPNGKRQRVPPATLGVQRGFSRGTVTALAPGRKAHRRA